MCENDQLTEWHPIKYLKDTNDQINDENYAIVVLNRPINLSTFPELWNNGEVNLFLCDPKNLHKFLFSNNTTLC